MRRKEFKFFLSLAALLLMLYKSSFAITLNLYQKVIVRLATIQSYVYYYANVPLEEPNFEIISCGESNAYYVPDEKKIKVCAELINDLVNECQSDTGPEKCVLDTISFIYLHEMGHAVIDYYYLPGVTGKEEDAADAFAFLASTFLNKEDFVWRGIDYFYTLYLSGAWGAYWDSHSLSIQRVYNLICWLYGYKPDKYQNFVLQVAPELIEYRNCVDEYKKLSSSWETLLEDYANFDFEKDKREINNKGITYEDISKLYIALFGRAPEGDGFNYWVKKSMENGWSIPELAENMYNAAIGYPDYAFLSNPQSLVESIYENVLGKSYNEDPQGINYWVEQLEDGTVTAGDVVPVIIYVAENQYPNHPATKTLINRAKAGLVIQYVESNFIGDFSPYRESILKVNSDESSIFDGVETFVRTLVEKYGE